MQRLAQRSGPATGRRRLWLAVLALAAGTLLTACGQAQPGVAASIDGHTLTVIDVQEHTAEFFESYPEAIGSAQPELVAAFAVENFLRDHVVDKIGATFDLEPTQSDLDAIAQRDFESLENFTRAVANQAVPSSRPDLVMAELRSYWIQNALRDLKREEIGSGPEQSDAVDIATRDVIDEFSAAADVSVNPRFGTWNGSVITDAPRSGSGSISIVPTAAAPGTGDAPAPGG